MKLSKSWLFTATTDYDGVQTIHEEVVNSETKLNSLSKAFKEAHNSRVMKIAGTTSKREIDFRFYAAKFSDGNYYLSRKELEKIKSAKPIPNIGSLKISIQPR